MTVSFTELGNFGFAYGKVYWTSEYTAYPSESLNLPGVAFTKNATFVSGESGEADPNEGGSYSVEECRQLCEHDTRCGAFVLFDWGDYYSSVSEHFECRLGTDARDKVAQG